MLFVLFIFSLCSAANVNDLTKNSNEAKDKISAMSLFFKAKVTQSVNDIKQAIKNDKIAYKMTVKSIKHDTSLALKEFIEAKKANKNATDLVDISTKTRNAEKEVIEQMTKLHNTFVQTLTNTSAGVKKTGKANKIEAEVSLVGVKTIGENLAKQLNAANTTDAQLQLVFTTASSGLKNLTSHMVNATKGQLKAIKTAVNFARLGEVKMLESYNNLYVIYKSSLSQSLFVNQTQPTTPSEKAEANKKAKAALKKDISDLKKIRRVVSKDLVNKNTTKKNTKNIEKKNNLKKASLTPKAKKCVSALKK
ncbi:hypothetical protein EHI8A_135730 [Entamoeba histolytica HM-1:IMSS-B]|uniref:Uncharacterized protein n=6 Tax=Entamoeba histolytica TaxID=5759 RepID=C4M4T0_ENTH1|nr:hypothetical protein EHI_095180 [Entamoeba histolytica HM-1:IMSS]EMD45130.1 Hypothetical protein EHI5A_171200 [Entamoeba histolytica KU27]EMH77396.1 hypothetical protein EHI8A_135730 [Entamoeba histolytica HM-1:IMSS-B]EMS13305.1 hypothetical protein KM1_089330 [Entamoeba histolytica HM-3:IMSS]ENY62498.1 hypothetical protein EHI7A_126420 [Entamoeba histolytica HM-1:IMSS-A]BAN38132.1 hypothetical protein [Entamoeba histolytica]|eukprot:XP_648638.1 hypothetical protein EHI_095180 [Entamoeba histolytica HM-1:IMSS]